MARRRFPWQRIDKAAPVLPAGAQTTTFTPDQLNALVQQAGIGTFNLLGRNPIYPSVPFGPSNPLTPTAINPVREDGRPDPRRYEFPVAWNVFVTEQRLVPWRTLRVAADQIDILRRCVEILKAKICGLDWDITLTESASEAITANNGKDHLRAMSQAREQYTPDIVRMREFWSQPDRINGLSFDDWLAMALEEILVLDAWAVYPHPDMKGDLHSFEILDGSTIKPLLDDRGMRPLAPFPAFQQILYGFPRGEFTATSDDPTQDGNFSADELIYLRRNHRTWTPYGYSPVERSLPLADLYIRRQQWLRAEFTDGVLPDMMFLANENFGNTPELLRAWENIFNDDLAGQTEQRKRARIIPDGLTPHETTNAAEKFKAEFDEYVIKGIAGHFGILPTELGLTPKSGLGGKGHQEGEAETAAEIGVGPLVQWLETQLSHMSYKFLGMPRELKFTFSGGRSGETAEDAKRRDVENRGGQRTLNESRADLGLPLIDSPLADAPMVVAGTGVYFMTPAGVVVAGSDGSSAEATVTDGQAVAAKPADTADEPEDSATTSKADDASHTPPKGVQVAAQRALAWIKDGHAGSGFTDVGRARAAQLAGGGAVSDDTIKRMRSFFARHTPDKQAEGFNSGEQGFPSPGRVAWDAWGGDAGESWANSITLTSDKSTDAEVRAFLKWSAKGSDRDFTFTTIDPMTAAALNKAHRTGNTDLVKATASVVLGKARGANAPS